MAKQKLRIVWAVDLFESTVETGPHLISTLRQIAEKEKVQVEPVYVLSPEGLDLALEFSPPWVKRYKPAAESSLKQALKNVNIPGLIEPKVLVQAKPSLHSMVKTLIQYAKTSNADLIALGTHARKGLNRLFMGSFAETTLLYSKIPVIVAGPSIESKRIDHILFATDFGKNATSLFQQSLSLAKAMSAKLTLFHSIPHPLEPVLQSGTYLLGGGWVDVPEYITQLEEENRKQADRWMASAKKQGVEAKVFFASGGGGNVSQAILDYAQTHHIGLIVMAAESGPMSAAVIGSISRQVVRNAPCPVWVMRA